MERAMAALVAVLVAAWTLGTLTDASADALAGMRRAAPVVHRDPVPAAPSAPPLTVVPVRSAGGKRVLHGREFVRTSAPRPPAVKLSDALRHTAGRRGTRSATGATITLLGDHNAYAVANQPQISDYTLGWDQQVGFDCSNLTPNESNLNWIIFPPDGSAFVNQATVGTDASGNCQSPVQDVTLATPFGSGTDAPYAGVWAVALRKSNGDYEAVTYFVVSSEAAMQTYSDGALNIATRDFTAGQTMYVVANGLNPSDDYAIGFVQASVPPIKCVHAVPSAFAALPNCFSKSVANAGVQATGGTFEASWDTSAAPVPASGNYTVQLYDVTQHHLVATQQVALQSASVVWTLTPYQGVTSGTTGLNDWTYAFDGFLDQAVTGLTYAASGIAANGTYRLTLSDPNGAVLTSGLAADGKHEAAAATVTVSGGSGTSTKIPFPLNVGKVTAVGPTVTYNAANTFTAQLYDPAGGTVLASKTLTLLAYSASLAWSAGSSVNAAPGNSCATSGLTSLTVTNTAGSSYGANNGDGIVGIKIDPDATNTEKVCGGDATATDSAGNTWNISYAGGTATATIASAKPAALASGQTLSFSVILAGPSSACGGPTCSLQTQIVPLHGLAYSGANSVSNGLIVGGKNNSSVPSSYAWAVTGPSPGGGITAPPPFSQIMYASGTDGVAPPSFYTVTATITNNNSSGNANTLNDVLFTFPSGYDFTAPAYTPSLVSLKTSGGTSIPGWSVFVKNGTSNNVTGSNSFAIANGTSGTTPNNPIQPGTTVVATLKIPMPPITFAEAQIPATANFDGGCIQVTGTHCTYATTGLTSVSSQNAVAGVMGVTSDELGVYSLDPAKMSGTFSPQTIGAGTATSSTFNFTNTPVSADPNPDYVDQITLTFPSGAQATSVTAPAGWTVTGSSPTFTATLNPCSPTPCQETGAVPPGGGLALTVNFPTTTTIGTYDGVGSDPPPVYWYVRGANGGTTTRTTTAYEGKSTLVVAPVSASVGFVALGGYPTPTTVPSGTEPVVGSDADATNGNAYDYRITNNGSIPITNATITIPAFNRAGGSGTDSGGQNWQIVGTPVASGCAVSVTQVQSATPTNGQIALSGCSVAPGASLDVTFNAKAPYEIGSEFDWKTTVCNGGGCSSPVTASPSYGTAEYVKIVVDGHLSVIFSNGAPVVGAAPSLPNPGPGGSGPGGSTPTTSCAGCSIVSLGATPVLSLGGIGGTTAFGDVVDASITSDAVGPDSWSLYVSIDANPLNGSGTKEFSMKIDSSVMVPLSGYTVPAAVTSLFQPNATGSGVYPTTASGTMLGTYNGSAHRLPIDSIHSFSVNNTGGTGTNSVTLMWTLVAN